MRAVVIQRNLAQAIESPQAAGTAAGLSGDWYRPGEHSPVSCLIYDLGRESCRSPFWQ